MATASKSVAPTKDEKAALEAERHAPVSLPSGGSYEASELQSKLDKVCDTDKPRDEAKVRDAIESASTDAGMTSTATGTIANHQTMRSETQLAAGAEVGEGKDKKVVGEVVVTELRQVYDPDSEDKDGGSAAVAAGGQAIAGGKSEVLSLEPVEDVVAEAETLVEAAAPPATGTPPAPGTPGADGNA